MVEEEPVGGIDRSIASDEELSLVGRCWSSVGRSIERFFIADVDGVSLESWSDSAAIAILEVPPESSGATADLGWDVS